MPVPKFDQYEPTIRNDQQHLDRFEQQRQGQVERHDHAHQHGLEHEHQADTGLVVYGADWCGWTQKQKAELAESGLKHKFVNCEKESCPGITGFPTLEVNGQQHPGFKDTAAIQALLGR